MSNGQTLDAFVAEAKADLDKFREAYLAKHQENPEHYPLIIPEDNAGVWFESFLTFWQSGEV